MRNISSSSAHKGAGNDSSSPIRMFKLKDFNTITGTNDY